MKKIGNINWLDIQTGREYEVITTQWEPAPAYRDQVLEIFAVSSIGFSGRACRDGYIYSFVFSDSLLFINYIEARLFELFFNLVYYEGLDSEDVYESCLWLFQDLSERI